MIELAKSTGQEETDGQQCALGATREVGASKADTERILGDPSQFADDESLRLEILTGNPAGFETLLARWSQSMLRVSRSVVADRETAEEVVQETWIAVMKGIDRFEGRSSLKTWVFTILMNRARARAKREWRSRPFSSLCEMPEDTERLVANAGRVSDDRHAWLSPHNRWTQTPEQRLLTRESIDIVRDQLRRMPARQAEVVVMRDVEGFTASEVCRSLGLSESNQRVLLHRGRATIRKALELHEDTAKCA